MLSPSSYVRFTGDVQGMLRGSLGGPDFGGIKVSCYKVFSVDECHALNYSDEMGSVGVVKLHKGPQNAGNHSQHWTMVDENREITTN